MIAYNGYHYARRRRVGTLGGIYYEITRNGAYVAYADTPEEAQRLIDTYCSWEKK